VTRHPPRDWDPLIKQTYSAWVETDRGRRKWHLSALNLSILWFCAYVFCSIAAYFTQATIDHLDSVDNIRVVCDLIVPENMFKSARIAKSRGKNDGARVRESSKLPSASMTSEHVSSPAQTLPSQPEVYGQIHMFQPYIDHVQTEVLDQQSICSSSSSPINTTDFQDPNQPGTEAYRSLSPYSQSQNPADNVHHECREYNYMSQTSSDACLSQTQSRSEQTPPSHTTAAFSPGDLSLSATSYDNVHAYSSHEQFFSSRPSWENVNSGSGIPSSSTYHQDESTNLTTPATSPESYLSSHTEINEPESYQIMALSPNECLTRRGGTSRESLPSLNMLHETYSFSYDFSVSMVPPATIAPPCESHEAFSNRPSISATKSSQKAKVLLGSDGLLRDLNLAPLNALSRRQPYRREPADDEALRQLPRFP